MNATKLDRGAACCTPVCVIIIGMTKSLYLLPESPYGKDNNGGKRDFLQREHDLYLIARLYLQGVPVKDIQREINDGYRIQGVEMSLSAHAIYQDLKEIHIRWINSALMDFNEAKGKELAKWDHLESVYWQAWERSLDAKTTEESQTIADEIAFAINQVVPIKRVKSRKKVEERDGAVAYLQGVERCIQERCKILGLYTPDRVQVDWRVEAQKSGIDVQTVSQQFEAMVTQFQKALEEKAASASSERSVASGPEPADM